MAVNCCGAFKYSLQRPSSDLHIRRISLAPQIYDKCRCRITMQDHQPYPQNRILIAKRLKQFSGKSTDSICSQNLSTAKISSGMTPSYLTLYTNFLKTSRNTRTDSSKYKRNNCRNRLKRFRLFSSQPLHRAYDLLTSASISTSVTSSVKEHMERCSRPSCRPAIVEMSSLGQ